MKLTTDLFNFEGKKIGEIDLPSEIFGVKVNDVVVHQVARWQSLNTYYPYAHTKDRSEVRGGGRKPWRQKGTGRARHGSIRSPIWVGGGVAFGPRKDTIKQIKINKKIKNKALAMVLTQKFKDNFLKIIDKISIEDFKTKNFDKFFSKFLQPRKTVKKRETALLVVDGNHQQIFRCVRNLPYADVIEARNLNVLSLLNHKYLFLTKDSLNVLQERLLKQNNKQQAEEENIYALAQS
ncbi:MAG: 50S ribosomal protein L4 [Candidatus Parcubacteria bacterium]|nr:MAG: 50S ribosomal protein L4 [Candidatus Parcubacteria bacterium]